MAKKITLTLLLILTSLGLFLLLSPRFEKSIKIEKDNKLEKESGSLPIQKEDSEENIHLFVSGWLPYWKKSEGIASLENNLGSFDEINPFSFEVGSDGNIIDTVGIKNSPWNSLKEKAKTENTKIIPTILWTDEVAMHEVFSDTELLDKHIGNITTMLEKNDFPGVDIDYEGKDMNDKDLFTGFIGQLASKLHQQNKKLSCTIESRTDNSPPSNWTGTQAMSYANDLPKLGELCDEVRIMAYDEIFQRNGMTKSFEIESETPHAPNADLDWVENVVKYMLRFIPKEKLVLGVPTYGWEFWFTETPKGLKYIRVKSVSFPEAMEKAKSADIEPKRNQGGELDFTYQAEDGKHIVTFSDAQAIKQKIELVEKYQLKGISIFKLDGLTDPGLFSILREYKE